MPREPDVKRTLVFVDGQNLFKSAQEAYGRVHPYTYPSYDIKALSLAICGLKGWHPLLFRFYTGIHDITRNPYLHGFWTKKLAQMGRCGVKTFTRTLRYDNGGIPREKGIDVRIAIDIIRCAHLNHYDVALVFSQDQDLSEAALELRKISMEQGRWIKIASAFPLGPHTTNSRGIEHTDWIPINQALYDSCIDPRDYR